MEKLTFSTTLTLPAELLKAADQVVSQGKVKSLNELVAQAIKHELEALKRAEIDAELAQMAQDPEYQSEVLKIETEFATASWEALHLGEQQHHITTKSQINPTQTQVKYLPLIHS